MELEQPDFPPLPSLKVFVEHLSLITAAGFVLSGFINAIIFWFRFKLVYFDIAQPSDVVMSGFIYVTGVVFAVAIFLLLNYLRRVFDWVTLFFIEHLNFQLADWLSRRLKRTIEPPTAAYMKRVIYFSNLVTLLIPFAIVGLTYAKPEWFADNQRLSRVTQSARFGAEPSRVGVGHLVISSDDPQHAKCGNAPVLWIGSASAIVDCRGMLRVIQNTQGLILDRIPIPTVSAPSKPAEEKPVP